MSPSTARYFQGSSVTGPVSAATAQTWSDLVDAFRVCPIVPFKRKDFLALSKAERNKEKIKLPFIVPACFKSSPSQRVYAEATHCNALLLDIDDSKDAAPFVKNPRLLNDALGDLNFAAYLTISSTPEAPRLRIAVDADGIPVEQYRAAVETIGALLALSTVTSESKVAVQAMFAPVIFLDSTDDQHPLIAYRTDGRAFKVADISAEGTDLYHVKSPNGSNGHLPNDPDALFFLKAPLPEITLAVAKDALSAIDPDVDRAQWRDVAAALRHQYSPHKDEEAFELFDEWSSGGSKYQDEDDTRKMWRSLRPSPLGRMPITIRTLLQRATEAGWSGQKIKDQSATLLLEWIEHVENATELLEDGVRKIVAAPLLSITQESMLVDQLKKAAHRRFGVNVQTAALKADIEKLKKQIQLREREERSKSEKSKEPSWAAGIVFVSNPGDYFRRSTGEKYKEQNFNAAFSCHLLPTKDQLRDAQKPITPETLCRPLVQPADYARNFLKVTKVYDYDYDPSQPTEVFFVRKQIKYVNTYHPTYPEPEPKHAKEAGEKILGHLQNLIGEPEYRQTFMDFLAYQVQFPGRKIRWATLVQSAEGAGKTFFAKVMQAALGYEHVKILSDESIKSGWNEWAFGHQLVAVEEIRVAGHNRHEIMNVIKPLITNDDISITERYRNSRQARNITNYLLFTNFHDALALTPNDRRYFVVKSPLQTEAQIKALGKDYFIPLFDFLEEHPGAVRSWLLNWPIGKEFCANGRAPRTKYASAMIDDSASDVVAAVRRLVLEGDASLVQYDIVSAVTLGQLLENQEGLRISGQQLAHVLRGEGYHPAGRHAFGEERHYLWARLGVENVVETALERVKKGQKNLCMELIYS